MSRDPRSGAEVVEHDLADIAKRASGELKVMAGESLLIVGGGGFLGYYMIQAVLAFNDVSGESPISVTVYDNWARGIPGWLSELADDGRVTIRTVDITQPLDETTQPHEWVIHAASIASPMFYRRHPIETMDANVNGLRNLLDHATTRDAARETLRGFLFFSTSEVYGDPTPDAIPTPETYRGNVSFTGPRACYDESKRYGETLAVNFARVHEVPIRIARPFNNYGPGLRLNDRRVIPDFASDILGGRDIVMYSSGRPTRTFCYVSDAVVGYLKVLTRGRDGESYNIGTEFPEISIADLAQRMAALAREELSYDGDVVRADSEDPEYMVDNPNRRCPNIAKARDELGFAPMVGLDEGLRRSLLWYRDIGAEWAQAS